MAKSRREKAKAATQKKAKAALRKIRAAEESGKTATSRREKVEAAIQKIRAFHDLGRNLPPRRGHKVDHGEGIIDAEAKRLHFSPDLLRKARQFADRIGGYTREELNDLCRLIREVQPGQDESLAIFEKTYVIRLLSVRRKEQRAALQEECIKKGWSLAELGREIAKRYGTRRAGGRRRKIPPDLTDFLVHLEGICEKWRRWKEELSRDPAEVTEKHVFLTDLPDDLRTQIRAVSKRIWTLHRAVSEKLNEVQPDREIRGVLQAGADDQKGSAGRQRRER